MSTPFPTLHTKRLLLRRLQVEDLDALVQYADNRKIADEVRSIPHPYTEPDAVFRIRYVLDGFKSGLRYVFAIILRERAELIGEISLHLDSKAVAQMGYWMGEPFWNRGFATEAVEAILGFGFGPLGLRKIYATCREANAASQAVLRKNGMTAGSVTGGALQYVLESSSGTMDKP